MGMRTLSPDWLASFSRNFRESSTGAPHLNFSLLKLAPVHRNVEVSCSDVLVLVLQAYDALECADRIDVVHAREVDQLHPHLLGDLPVHLQQVWPGALPDRVVQYKGTGVLDVRYPAVGLRP